MTGSISAPSIAGYRYSDASSNHAHNYLLPAVFQELRRVAPSRVFDLGCGNGSVANELAQAGYEVVGIDPSTEGITVANEEYPHLQLFEGSAYDNDLVQRFGLFPALIKIGRAHV